MDDNQKQSGPLSDPTTFKRPRGRPRKSHISMTLANLPSVEERVVSDPTSYEPGVHDKSITLAARVAIERALRLDPNATDVPFWLRKASLAVQVLQQFEGSKSVVWAKADANKWPLTNAAFDKEIADKTKSINELAKYLTKNPIPSVGDKAIASAESLGSDFAEPKD